jgi:radical SAM protein with 4Fe4S-binding SPASM domain
MVSNSFEYKEGYIRMDIKNFVCLQPFRFLEIREDGNCYPCCPGWGRIVFGNIFQHSFEDIWNGENARKMRRSVLDGTYEYCDFKKCKVLPDGMDHNENIKVLFEKSELGPKFSEVMNEYPQTVNFGQDAQCNVRCVICRDCQKYTSQEQIKKLNEKIPQLFLPMLKDAKRVICSSSGELFASKHSRDLVKAISHKYPHIKFTVRTNGLMCDEKNCLDLGILDKMDNVIVSLHAATQKTYNKMVLDSDFYKIIENIKWLSSLNNAGGGIAFGIRGH